MDKETLHVESTTGKVVHGPRVLKANVQMESLRALKMTVARMTGRGDGMMNKINSTSGRSETAAAGSMPEAGVP